MTHNHNLKVSAAGWDRVHIFRHHQPGDGGPHAYGADAVRLEPSTSDGLTSAKMLGWGRLKRNVIVFVERSAPALAAHLEACAAACGVEPPPAVSAEARRDWEALAREFPTLEPIE